MRAWLYPILHRLSAGLVPLDGDFGRREPGAEKDDPSPQVQPARHEPRPRVEEAAWIPSTIFFGPPL